MLKVGDRIRLKRGTTNSDKIWSTFSSNADRNRTVMVVTHIIDNDRCKVEGFTGSYVFDDVELVRPLILIGGKRA